MHFSMFSCSHFSQSNDPRAMAKRQMQEGKQGGEDERVVAQSRLARNLVTGLQLPSSNSTHSLESLRANCSTLDSLSTEKVVSMVSNENSASSSQVRHTDTVPNSTTEKLVARSKKSTIGRMAFLPMKSGTAFSVFFNIMDISKFSSGHFSSISSLHTMSRRLIQRRR